MTNPATASVSSQMQVPPGRRVLQQHGARFTTDRRSRARGRQRPVGRRHGCDRTSRGRAARRWLACMRTRCGHGGVVKRPTPRTMNAIDSTLSDEQRDRDAEREEAQRQPAGGRQQSGSVRLRGTGSVPVPSTFARWSTSHAPSPEPHPPERRGDRPSPPVRLQSAPPFRPGHGDRPPEGGVPDDTPRARPLSPGEGALAAGTRRAPVPSVVATTYPALTRGN